MNKVIKHIWAIRHWKLHQSEGISYYVKCHILCLKLISPLLFWYHKNWVRKYNRHHNIWWWNEKRDYRCDVRSISIDFNIVHQTILLILPLLCVMNSRSEFSWLIFTITTKISLLLSSLVHILHWLKMLFSHHLICFLHMLFSQLSVNILMLLLS